MWDLTFETRLPIGLGARSLKWNNARLPTNNDFLELVLLEPGSYWLTAKVVGKESAPMDFVPLLVRPDLDSMLCEPGSMRYYSSG